MVNFILLDPRYVTTVRDRTVPRQPFCDLIFSTFCYLEGILWLKTSRKLVGGGSQFRSVLRSLGSSRTVQDNTNGQPVGTDQWPRGSPRDESPTTLYSQISPGKWVVTKRVRQWTHTQTLCHWSVHWSFDRCLWRSPNSPLTFYFIYILVAVPSVVLSHLKFESVSGKKNETLKLYFMSRFLSELQKICENTFPFSHKGTVTTTSGQNSGTESFNSFSSWKTSVCFPTVYWVLVLYILITLKCSSHVVYGNIEPVVFLFRLFDFVGDGGQNRHFVDLMWPCY